jgi:riboflavin transport system permease protein
MNGRLKNNIATTLGILLSIVVALVIAVVLILVLSKKPTTTLYWYFVGPFIDRYTFFNMIESSIPLIFAGLGMAIAFKSGVVNLGGEGQIFAGAILPVILAGILPSLPGAIGIPVLLLGGACVGAALASVSGWMRMKWDVSDLLTTYLISTGMVYVINYLILGPLRDPAQITIQSAALPPAYLLGRLALPSYLHTGIILAVVGAVLVFFMMYRTHLGFELRVAGSNRQFARYVGINVKGYYLIPMALSGALIGLGGSVEVVGRYQACFSSLTAGLGWNGIAVALIARNNPLGVVPAALFFAYLSTGAKVAMMNSDVTVELAAIISSILFYLVTAEAAFSFFRRSLGL